MLQVNSKTVTLDIWGVDEDGTWLADVFVNQNKSVQVPTPCFFFFFLPATVWTC